MTRVASFSIEDANRIAAAVRGHERSIRELQAKTNRQDHRRTPLASLEPDIITANQSTGDSTSIVPGDLCWVTRQTGATPGGRDAFQVTNNLADPSLQNGSIYYLSNGIALDPLDHTNANIKGRICISGVCEANIYYPNFPDLDSTLPDAMRGAAFVFPGQNTLEYYARDYEASIRIEGTTVGIGPRGYFLRMSEAVVADTVAKAWIYLVPVVIDATAVELYAYLQSPSPGWQYLGTDVSRYFDATPGTHLDVKLAGSYSIEMQATASILLPANNTDSVYSWDDTFIANNAGAAAFFPSVYDSISSPRTTTMFKTSYVTGALTGSPGAITPDSIDFDVANIAGSGTASREEIYLWVVPTATEVYEEP